MIQRRRRKELERLLGSLKGEEAFAALEDRAHDSGHLGEEDHERLLSGELEGAPADNLRRHVLFCDLCSEEFLRRAGRRAEPEERAARGSPRRRLLIAFAIAAGAALAGLLVWELAAPAPDPFPPRAVQAGLGRALGGAAARHPDRLFLRLEPPQRSPVWVYAFLAGTEEFVPLHPDPATGHENPLQGEVVPAEGWQDLEVAGPRTLLVLVSRRPLPTLATQGDIESLALQLDMAREGQVAPDELLQSLEEQLLSAEGRAYLVGIRE